MFRRLLSSLLLSLYLFTGTGLVEWLRLPALLSHYFDHCDQKEIGFMEYLALHYVDGNHADTGVHDGRHLPFKSPDTGLFTAIHAILPEAYSVAFGYRPDPVSSSAVAAIWLPQGLYAGAIWQPPRVI